MVDLLTYLGVTAGWSFVFKPILEDLAKESIKDFASDFCSGALKDVLGARDHWRRVAAKALKDFLEQFEQELIGAGETEQGTAVYTDSLRCFAKLPAVREVLGSAITDPDKPVNATSLAETWSKQGLERLPHDFDWAKLTRRYQSKARAILRESAELRVIVDSQHQRTAADATERIAGLTPGFDTGIYAEGLRKRYGYLKLESLEASPENQRIALTRVFVEQTVRSCQQCNPRVYELPIEQRRRLTEQGGLERELEEKEVRRQRESFLKQPPSPVLGVVTDNRERLYVVLGDPGSGKSVLLDYLDLQWAELPPVERTVHPLPLLIELKTYAENVGKGVCRDFLGYLDHGGGSVAQLDQKELDVLLQRGGAVFLLDGLDEIFDRPTRQQVAHDIVRFSIRYPLARFLVTSRSIGYDLVASILRDAGFHHFLVQDFDELQQETFIRRWHELACADLTERAEKSGRLRVSISNVAAIRELAQNPLLLTLMALLNRHQELPNDRNELYEQASKLMLQQWDASKALREDPLLKDQSFDYKDKQAMLRAVAFQMQTSPHGLAGNVIAEDSLEQTLVEHLKNQGYTNPRPIAGRLIQQLRERNFILCLLGDNYFAFVHRTFLEFFCAWAWVWKFEKEKSLTFEELQRETFEAHWEDEKWGEVLGLVAARIEPQFTRLLIETLLDKKAPQDRSKHLFLAARCYADVRNKTPLQGVSRELEQRLKGLIQRRLRRAGSAGTMEELWEKDDWADFDDYWEVVYDSDGRIVKSVGTQAVRAVAMCWPKNPSTKEWLVSLHDSHSSTGVCVAAVEEVARGWRSDKETLPWLKEIATTSRSGSVREAAVRELARGWKDLNHTVLWLLERGQSDSDLRVRLIAARELLRGWKEDHRVLPWLRDRVRFYQGANQVQQALREVARSSQDDSTALQWLSQVAELAEDWVIRSYAAKALAVL